MQTTVCNGVVSKDKEQENFVCPPEVLRAMDEVIDRHNRKRKWVTYVAAILAFLEEGDREIARRVGEAAAAEHTGYGPLVERSKRLGAVNDREAVQTGGGVNRLAATDEKGTAAPDEQPGGANGGASRRKKPR